VSFTSPAGGYLCAGFRCAVFHFATGWIPPPIFFHYAIGWIHQPLFISRWADALVLFMLVILDFFRVDQIKYAIEF
jgi:hypothetical protein